MSASHDTRDSSGRAMAGQEVAPGLPPRFYAHAMSAYYFAFWAWPAGLPGMDEGEEPDHNTASGLDGAAVAEWEDAVQGVIERLPRLLTLALRVGQESSELGGYARRLLEEIDMDTLCQPIPPEQGEDDDED